jgi:serine/threonine protein kinase
MATVFKARQRSSGRVCALKVLREFETMEEARAQRRLERFTREREILERLEHPNVVRVIECSVARSPGGGPAAWLALEYAEGATVEELLEREGGPLPVDVVLAVVVEVARALAHLASRGVVHRDVKPANLVVTTAGNVRLVDFGIACLMDGTERNSDEAPLAAAQDLPIGTIDYMAPEQVEGDAVDERADLFALGSTAYRCLAGMSPFTGDTVFARLRELVERQPPPLPRHVPRAFSALVLQLLSKDPAARPDANELHAELEEIIRGMRGGAPQIDAGERGLAGAWGRTALSELVARGRRPRPAVSTPVVCVLHSAEKTIERKLLVGEGYVIGRSLHDGQASSSIGKPWISRQHCRIELGERGLVVTDLGSANGTSVNKLRLVPSSSALLRPGDTLTLGKTSFTVALENAPASMTQPSWRCLLCGVELPPDAASNDEATGIEERHLCARCRGRIKEDRSAAEKRAREAIAELGVAVTKRYELVGPILRFEVVAPEGKRRAAHALDLGPAAARRYIELSKRALDLDDPGILHARALHETRGVLVVVTDPLEGRPSSEVVLRDGPLAAPQAQSVVAALARAYAHARAKGVTSLAIRPSLVLLGEKGVKALDVGLAPGLVEAGRSRVDIGRSMPCYDAPEAQSGRESPPRATVFSIAAVAHFLLTGERPVELRSRGRRVRGEPLSSRREVPGDLARILDAALSDDPAQRPESPLDLARALEALSFVPGPRRSTGARTQTMRRLDPKDLET